MVTGIAYSVIPEALQNMSGGLENLGVIFLVFCLDTFASGALRMSLCFQYKIIIVDCATKRVNPCNVNAVKQGEACIE